MADKRARGGSRQQGLGLGRIFLCLAVTLCHADIAFATQKAKRPRPKPPRPAKLNATWDPLTIVSGSPFVIRVTASLPLRSLTATWLGKDLQFDFDRGTSEWFALSGVSLDVTAGRHSLVLSGETIPGVKSFRSQMLTITRGKYESSALSVARQYTEPDPLTSERIAEEQTLKRTLFAAVSAGRQWTGAFVAPIKSVITEPFGTQRTFNGVVQSVHHGLDFRAPTGTPIQAMNAGKVVLARELFFEGNCVVIDHGQGLLTLYLHLSEIQVKEGDRVDKSQTLGLSGATGRVTAPHLHAAVRWKGIYLNPARLFTLRLPD